MRRTTAGLLLCLAFLVSVEFAGAREGQSKDRKAPGLSKTTGAPVSTLVNINNLAMWVRNDGWSARNPSTGNSGVTFPRGTTESIFADGLIWGGFVQDGGTVNPRIGGQTYSIGTLPGRIISPGVAEDPDATTNPGVRIFRVRQDWATADLRQDAAELNNKAIGVVSEGDVQVLRDQYKQDWLEWPWEKGAPYYDRNNNGIYDPDPNAALPDTLTDEPGIAGADQVVWFVMNDLNPGATTALYGAPPIGLEIQVTLWGYARTDALGNVIFKQVRMIYKGTATTPPTATIDSMYFAQWSDPDLGDFGDDFVGSDTTLSLGYVYNSSTIDNAYVQFGLAPPAAGYDFLQGPIVPGDPDDEAIFGLKIRKGFKNLPMTAFVFFSASGGISDPDFDFGGGLSWYNLLRGFKPLPNDIVNPTPFFDPAGNQTTFTFPGNPVTGEGWNDSGPADRRMVLASGPFTMALGDTQEVVVGLLAGLGADRLSSISVLKFVDISVQNAYDNFFELSKAPASPVLKIAALDQELILNWAFDEAAVQLTEGQDEKGYEFEGYNVYQLPSVAASFGQAIKLATFDVVNQVTTILDDVFDEESGQILLKPTQLGKNSGIQRVLLITEDKIRGGALVNGQTYYFAVTAYNNNSSPDVAVHSLETPLGVISAVPHSAAPGVRFSAAFGDTVLSTHTGASDGSVIALVVDPSSATGHMYEVTFDTLAGNIPVWNLTDVTLGTTLLSNQTNQTGDDNYLTVDGLQFKVTGAPNDFKEFLVVANAAGPIDPPEGGAADFQGFPSLRPTDGQQVGEGHWFFHTGDNGTRGSFDAFKERVARSDNFSRLIPFDFEMRFTARGSFAVRAFSDEVINQVPFELWNIGVGTPGDPSDDYRMIPWYLSLDVVGDPDPDPSLYQVKPIDHSASGGTDDPFTPWIYWRDPIDTSPGEAGYDAYVASLDLVSVPTNAGTYDFTSPEVMARTVLINWNGGDATDPTFPANINQLVPEEGTIFRIIMTKPNSLTDSFTLSAPAVTESPDLAKSDVENINVFPNPYLGLNRAELDRFSRFVTFNHLPTRATIRIFNLAGVMVRTIEKDDAGTQFAQWDLNNDSSLPVASGIYIALIDMPDVGAQKTLKLIIIQEQQVLDFF